MGVALRQRRAPSLGYLTIALLPAEILSGSTYESPLHTAARQDDAGTVKRLVLDDAIIDSIAHPEGHTPLIVATKTGSEQAVATLLAYGADWKIKDKEGFMPIALAAMHGHGAVVRAMLRHDVEPNDKNVNDGLLPLHRACSQDTDAHHDAVMALLENGIRADLKTRDGRDCVDLAKTTRMRKTIKKWIHKLHRTGMEMEKPRPPRPDPVLPAGVHQPSVNPYSYRRPDL
eukprot:gnl/TRDRNA2_/TRDRNA2_162831_c0_seq1.p1 gnl/TRDRNA2_/TRDRNA2_162831_c0~~gnl/TRDRNA2_/TRDRNA2_162831_c0_seq1.p1  ORF type:complete len:230 (+),score=34.51 gnl/TRDRNA2_/TRDRNA2_162831_c0_seq1:48-737(+)